ncbi:MAG: hypothetical protein IT276_15770 [Ignavibacteriaceae bacterium]|nr:hypothetical protein [Ignavibacterium sp.]MCC6256372.1 hypothetical protein [Ignavibacteriaceae bacterium]HRN26389.1 hypothetical protein [Ignavibacteriaceae bacterium]
MKTLTPLKLIILLLIISVNHIVPQGKVYLVLGSDTAIWDGMNTAKYNCYYNLDLFTATSSNTSVVMSDAFRSQIVDSYGNKLKMTWWMMAGNIFRYATNNNVPISNTMTLYLMKKYFGDKIETWSDELSLHYHTFWWTDYDGDGKYWWNQAQTFLETKDDFDFTLAQYLLEENVFPVSFRSGWHYMDNDWQNYLNDLLPYSLHNDYPNKRNDITEPIDNVYDWSLSSPEFVPFHPATDNYQLSGDGKGWNVRSKYMGSVTQQLMDQIFQKANLGTDQVICLWSHLPDQNFLTEIQQVNTIAHQSATNYPAVQFKYCTAIEAYQLWLQGNDVQEPILQLTEELTGTDVRFLINTDETIFQSQPFVAVKDRYERYFKVDCENVSQNMWRTLTSFPLGEIAKVGVAVTDTVGNVATSFIKYLPDDKFIDNGDSDYSEIYGNWVTSTVAAWNIDSRVANLNNGDSTKAKWNLDVELSGVYNVFIQFPEISNHIDTVYFDLYKNGIVQDSTVISLSGEFEKWLYVSTINLNTSENNFIEMSAKNNQSSAKTLAADVLKITAYVRERQLVTKTEFIDLNEVSIEDTVLFNLELGNIGINNLTINSISSTGGNIELTSSFPIIISGMNNLNIPLRFIANEIGALEDTIIVDSDDPINPIKKIPFAVLVENYFKIVDNDDFGSYSETGSWFTSVAQSYGLSSRYAFIQSSLNGPTATFTFELNKSGVYDIFETLPITVNSANNALYLIIKNGVVIDSIYLNQNEGSGGWKNIGRYFLPAQTTVAIKVIDSGESSSGPVIRADAFKISLFEETTDIADDDERSIPTEFTLSQNYPNPFNPSTKISWQSPVGSYQTLKVYDVLGNEVVTLVDEFRNAGIYEIEFKSSVGSHQLASGVYYYQLRAVDPSTSLPAGRQGSGQSFVETKKMILIK